MTIIFSFRYFKTTLNFQVNNSYYFNYECWVVRSKKSLIRYGFLGWKFIYEEYSYIHCRQ